MNRLLLAALGCAVVSFAGSANAITVDGQLDAAYGPAKSSVIYDPAAPTSNFQTPTNLTNGPAYSVYLNESGGFVYGYIQQTPGTAGTSAGPFSNLYFGDPGTSGVNGSRGSVIGFHITTQDAFDPNTSVSVAAPLVQFAFNAGNTALEFAIPDSYFTQPLGSITAGFNAGDTLALRLSQTFSYSVAGGETYGAARLGTVVLGSGGVAAPGPLAGAGLPALFGLGAAWFAARRRRAACSA